MWEMVLKTTPELLLVSLQIAALGALLALVGVFITAMILGIVGFLIERILMLGRTPKRPFGNIIRLDKRKKWPETIKIEFEETK